MLVRKLGGWEPGALEDVQFVVLQPVTDFLGYSSEIAQANLARIVVVEQLERPLNLFHRVPRQYPLAHYNQRY